MPVQKTKQLTACDGHLILLEYLEEAPLLLSRPGMSVRLATYFRKKKEGDSKPEELLTGDLMLMQPLPDVRNSHDQGTLFVLLVSMHFSRTVWMQDS